MLVGRTGIRALLEREQIMGLAADHATARAAEELVRGNQWQNVGCAPLDTSPGARQLWAEFTDSRLAPAMTIASLPEMRATCSCAATRFPCRHVVALLLRDFDMPLENSATLPDWLSPAAGSRAASSAAGGDDESVRREAAVVAGMADLRLWLSDLAREGLAGLPKRGRGVWLGAADRLEDAYAPEAARELRAMAIIPGSGTDWPERLLPRLGRLALLGEAFARLDDLSPGERGDAFYAAGHLVPSAEALIADEWLVLGRVTEVENRTIRARTWLRGRASGRWARLDQVCAAGRLEGVILPVGAVAAGELVFTPSAYPLLARAEHPLRVVGGRLGEDFSGHTGFHNALHDYVAALVLNPWLRLHPLAVQEVFVEPPALADSRWRLRDRDGRLLPLPLQFGHGWRLLAQAADRPLALFGEWDGTMFYPSSVYNDGWRSIASWRAVV